MRNMKNHDWHLNKKNKTEKADKCTLPISHIPTQSCNENREGDREKTKRKLLIKLIGYYSCGIRSINCLALRDINYSLEMWPKVVTSASHIMPP